MDHIFRDENQEIIVSSVGGTIKRWKFKGIDIFYPQKMLEISGQQKLRGGMHPCWPNFGSVDPKFGLPKHGPLRIREANRVDGNIMYFRGTDLLGSAIEQESEIQIVVTLLPEGFLYTLRARLRGMKSSDIFITPGLHPYFRTPKGIARIIVDDGWLEVTSENRDPDTMQINQRTYVLIPGLGDICMNVGDIWVGDKPQYATVWRDSAKYICVEPKFGYSGDDYGQKQNVHRLSTAWFKMSCGFEVALD